MRFTTWLFNQASVYVLLSRYSIASMHNRQPNAAD